MEIVITLTISKPSAIFHTNVTRKICQLMKCCNLIGAATIVAARTSGVCVSHQTTYRSEIISARKGSAAGSRDYTLYMAYITYNRHCDHYQKYFGISL